MKVLTTLFPVFFMLGVGFLARVRGWITPEQKDGAKTLVFGILFPILIFNAIFTAQLSVSTALIVLYVTAAFIVSWIIGTFTAKYTSGRFAHLTPYLMTTCEGGNVALPLYTTIVGAGYAINTVTFDLAGVVLAFILIPAAVAVKTSGSMDLKALLKNMMKNSFVIASVLGLVLNLCGVYGMLSASPLLDLYSGAVNAAIAPVSGVILFTLGYDLNADTEMLKPIAGASLARFLTGGLIIAGFFLFFPSLMADHIFRTAVLLYFMCPTGFATPSQVRPLCKDTSEEQFMSSFVSMYMIITLIVYIVIVLAG